MVFLKPSMIKAGFFLVAGSPDQVPRTTQKAASPGQRGDLQRSPGEEVRHLAATAGPGWAARPGEHVQMVTGTSQGEGPRRQRPVSGRPGFQLSAPAAAAAHRAGLGLRLEESCSRLRSLIIEDLNLTKLVVLF